MWTGGGGEGESLRITQPAAVLRRRDALRSDGLTPAEALIGQVPFETRLEQSPRRSLARRYPARIDERVPQPHSLARRDEDLAARRTDERSRPDAFDGLRPHHRRTVIGHEHGT